MFLAGILCAYDIVAIPFFLFWSYAAYTFHEDFHAVMYLTSVAYLVVLTASSIGLSFLRKWGGMLYIAFLLLDIIPNVLASARLTAFKLAPLLLPLLSLHIQRSISEESLRMSINILYYGFITLFGLGTWRLWRSGRLV
jgi:hypothetical protein